jgi:hypothetical protein
VQGVLFDCRGPLSRHGSGMVARIGENFHYFSTVFTFLLFGLFSKAKGKGSHGGCLFFL